MRFDRPPFVLDERDALLTEIEAAFDGVSREDGVSWQDAAVIDAYGDTRVAAYVWDGDTRWQDLLDRKRGIPGTGIGVWPFLDPIGFRYYLPVAMTLSVQSGDEETICHPLTFRKGGTDTYPASLWTLLDPRQRRCVKRFLQYMTVVETLAWPQHVANHWFAALNGYWKAVPDED